MLKSMMDFDLRKFEIEICESHISYTKARIFTNVAQKIRNKRIASYTRKWRAVNTQNTCTYGRSYAIFETWCLLEEIIAS